MKTHVFVSARGAPLVVSGLVFIAVTYGLVRLTYGLFLPNVQDSIGLDAPTAGLISAGTSLMYCAAAICGFFGAATHPRALIVGAMTTGACGVWTMAASHSIALFALGAIISSAAAGLTSPALVRLVHGAVPAPRVDRAQSTVNAGTGPGLIAAGLLALAVLPNWRLAWASIGVVTVASAVAVLAAHRAASTRIGDGAPDSVTDVFPPTASEPQRTWILRHRKAFAVAILMGIAAGAVWTYGRSALVAGQGVDAPATTTTIAWILIGVGGTVVIATAGPMDRLAPTTAWALSCSVLGASVLAIGTVPQLTAVAWLACTVFGWGFVAGTSALIAWTTRIEPDRASAGTAMLFVTLVIGQAIGAGALGFLIDATNFAVAFTAAALAAAMAAAPTISRFSRPRQVAV